MGRAKIVPDSSKSNFQRVRHLHFCLCKGIIGPWLLNGPGSSLKKNKQKQNKTKTPQNSSIQAAGCLNELPKFTDSVYTTRMWPDSFCKFWIIRNSYNIYSQETEILKRGHWLICRMFIFLCTCFAYNLWNRRTKSTVEFVSSTNLIIDLQKISFYWVFLISAVS